MNYSIDKRLTNLESAIRIDQGKKSISPAALSNLSDIELKQRLFACIDELYPNDIPSEISEHLARLKIAQEYAAYRGQKSKTNIGGIENEQRI